MITENQTGDINLMPGPRRGFSKAFTLVEILGVVAIIGIVAGIVLAAAGGVQKKAARDQAKAEIKTIVLALERYRAANGFYPIPAANPSTNALYANLANYMPFRTNQLSGTGTNLAVLDPYGYPYWYRLVTNNVTPGSGTVNMTGESVEVWSVGSDGKSGYTNANLTPAQRTTNSNADDLTSWN